MTPPCDPHLVSVIVPAYNAAAYLAEAITSILAQRHRPLEVIVVDDGSTDDSPRIAEQFGPLVRCHRQANAGPSAARNSGLSIAQGDVIAFLDADDLYVPDKFAWQIARLDADAGVDVVIGRQQYFDLVGAAGEGATFQPLQEDRLALQLGCAMFRRQVFDRVGLFDESMQYCEDWDWFFRAREIGVGLRLHRDVVLHQRLHETNITRQRELSQKYQMLMFKRSLDRRRAGGAVVGSLPPLASFLEPDTTQPS
jgi:glycosyltransferase involved in cell wall biosynthesis